TPCYWGSHWPLARGNATGNAIDDRIALSPCHNSVMSWVNAKPKPVRTAELNTVDTLGRSRPMTVRTWVWTIGMTDASDSRLREWASSTSAPPALEIKKGRIEFDSYVPERRALRLGVVGKEVALTIRPKTVCVNPVFELVGAPSTEVSV